MGIGTKVCLEPVDIKILEIPEIREKFKRCMEKECRFWP